MTGAASIPMPLPHPAESDAEVPSPAASRAELEAAAGRAAEEEAASDDALMCAVRAGRLEALGPLFDRHHGPLLNFFLRSGMADRAGGEDLVQDVFVRILKYRASYRPGTRFLSWLYTIARHAGLDHAQNRRGEVAWDDAFAPPVHPGDGAQSEQEQRLLARALQRLPPEKREVLVLSRFQELSYEQIGEVLGCRPGAVKVRVHRAVRELRHCYLQLTE